MKNTTVLIVVGKDIALDDLARQLENLRAIPARAAVLLVAQMPQFPYYALGVPPYGATELPAEWQEEVSTASADLKAREDGIEALLQQHDVSGEVSSIGCAPYDIADAVARHTMVCDMVQISREIRDTPDVFQQVVYGVLFQSPVGLLLNDPTAKILAGPQRVFVAWDTHLHTARAVHQALPLLRDAQEVVIGTIDPDMRAFGDGEDPGVDVAKWLTHHGCNVTVGQYPSGGHEIGRCILERSREAGADLIVMGSYGRSRARQAVFGGTTRTLIEQTEHPVFLAH